MGVPAFFRWLVKPCPQLIDTANTSKGSNNGNPKIDNLYLDMNGIIHPCTHPQQSPEIPIPKSEEDMWSNIRRYLDVIIEIVDPQ